MCLHSVFAASIVQELYKGLAAAATAEVDLVITYKCKEMLQGNVGGRHGDGEPRY